MTIALVLEPDETCERCGVVLYPHEHTYCVSCADREIARDREQLDRECIFETRAFALTEEP